MASSTTTVVVDLPNPREAARSGGYKLHPLFSSPAADVLLYSTDAVMYRVHSYTLRMASGFFRDMFTLPQPSLPAGNEDVCVPGHRESRILLPTYENSNILTLFLMLITGTPVHSPLHEWGVVTAASTSSSSSCYLSNTDSTTSHPCFDVIDGILRLAENWDAPGPLSYIRFGIQSAELVRLDPLRLYAIASHFGWENERSWAAQHTMKLDILQASDVGTLETLERMSSKDLMSLLNLRHRRREEFRELLDDPDSFSVGNSEETPLCTQCGETPINNRTWKALKEAMVVEMDKRPLGDSILGFDVDGIGEEIFEGGILTWPEAEACFDAACMKEGCGGLYYDKCATLKQLQACVDDLPWDL
ncbi:hypothetical protein BT96DRAFT_182197 [Gymnopus androsaceus JB14]|uniref:BTB domain-containing protein n=1 Tax=Gymnopus androsaceus JB14 TaxID=1447944 RepID=A0A6A4GBJ7_9AGAR|nr:hypothetical protein BT96DRAFT_182197 [Gymnopus androsaceus JB14]